MMTTSVWLCGMVFVNPLPRDSNLKIDREHECMDTPRSPPGIQGFISYEMQCNWKLFYENAHLGYLHDRTWVRSIQVRTFGSQRRSRRLVFNRAWKEGVNTCSRLS